eukprot:Gregarina_sp_Poly_1__4712@NODE_2517_length_2037_cov_118_329442_g1599_i0_p1_GENE_NODE_2517_length_2037_cov_118_329442_g1599_i0NODE_2517_length_2037_cov_118_329442_g1599_i0_p1_ORF_typecomplete_len375_score34_91Glyco_transf_43/PF03360_16/7_9e28_NODE_2517_length_2037_cov_118_329442_g1599_i0671125
MSTKWLQATHLLRHFTRHRVGWASILLSFVVLLASLIPVWIYWSGQWLAHSFESAAQNNHIYFLTPTHPTTARELHVLRLASQLAVVPNLTWVLVEDAPQIDEILERQLRTIVSETKRQCGLRDGDGFNYVYTHVLETKRREFDACRGLEPRFHALRLVFARIQNGTWPPGVFYFGDDDNVYTYELLNDLRKVTRIGVWPGGSFDEGGINFPLVSEDGKVQGFVDAWSPRKYPLDMANMGIYSQFVISQLPFEDPLSHWYPERCRSGMMETLLLERLGLNGWHSFQAFNSTAVRFWHTRTAHNAVSHKAVSALIDIVSSAAIKARLETFVDSSLTPNWVPQAIQYDVQLLSR